MCIRDRLSTLLRKADTAPFCAPVRGPVQGAKKKISMGNTKKSGRARTQTFVLPQKDAVSGVCSEQDDKRFRFRLGRPRAEAHAVSYTHLRSLRRALASICLIRSRVTWKLWPTSSNVCSEPSSRPKRILMTRSSRGVRVRRTCEVYSLRSVSYTHLDVYKRQAVPSRVTQGILSHPLTAESI